MKTRKLLALAIVALSWMGCSQEEEVINQMQGGAHTIEATIEGTTRSTVTDAGVFSWAAGDQIIVIENESLKATYTYLSGNEFTYQGNGVVSLTPVVAYYPANNSHTTAAFYLPETYGDTDTEYVADTHAAMIATPPTSGNTYAFMHLGGVMRFNVEDVPVGTTAFSFTATGKDIFGNFTVIENNGVKTIATADGSNSTVTINFKALTEAKDMTFYVPLPTGTYGDYTVALKIGDETKSHTSTGVINIINRKTLLLMPTFTYNGTDLGKSIADVDVVDLEEGSTSANISEDADVVVTPGTAADAVATLNYTPAGDGTSTLALSDGSADNIESAAESAGKVVVETAADATVASCNIDMPTMTVELNAASGTATYNEVSALTAENTLIIGEGVTVKKLKIKGGKVRIKGNVESIEADAETTITLENNITLSSPIRISKAVTIDLNGYSITPVASGWSTASGDDALIMVNRGGTLTINDNTSSGMIDTGDNTEFYPAVKLTEPADAENSDNAAALILNGGTLKGKYYGISGNGNPGRGNTSITINGGTVTSYQGTAIYNPQENSTVTITNGTITAEEAAIEMRSGSLTVSGGTFAATATAADAEANGNGTTIVGAAIAVSQHTTNNDLSVTISGGTFTGVYALYESDLHDESVANISMSVTGGTFNGKIYSENFSSGFITGGTFTDASVFDYLAANANITLGANITTAPNTVIPAGVTINGGGHSVNTTIADEEVATGKGKGVFQLAGGTIKNITFASPNTQYDIIVTAGDSRIEGCSFPTPTNSSMNAGKRGIFTGADAVTGDLAVADCTFDDQVYAFNFSNASNTMDITFFDCTLGGWLSGHGNSLEFYNCIFQQSGNYKNYIPYCQATFNGCTFKDGFTISLKHATRLRFEEYCKVGTETITTPTQLSWDYSGDGTTDTDPETVEIVTTTDITTWVNGILGNDSNDTVNPNWVQQ